jgi:hypothetical protein
MTARRGEGSDVLKTSHLELTRTAACIPDVRPQIRAGTQIRAGIQNLDAMKGAELWSVRRKQLARCRHVNHV